jgi:putative drug exporter of the RND superfamily
VLSVLTRCALAAPKRIVIVMALMALASAAFGVQVSSVLTPGGFQDPNSESARATQLLADVFGRGDVQLALVVSDPGGAEGVAAQTVGRRITERLERSPDVLAVESPWTSPPQRVDALYSTDGRSLLIVADLKGDDSDAPGYASALVDAMGADRAGFSDVVVEAGGSAMVYHQITRQTLRDVLIMESIAVPLSLLVLVWAFGGLAAALLPIVVAAVSIAVSIAVLRAIAMWTDVSIFALNLTTALGLALAIDYTLLILSRFRDEVAAGADRDQALRTTMATAGRTMSLSGVVVALSMAAMVLFPVPFLRSFAYAGVSTVLLCAAVALVLTPALIVVLGAKLDARPGRHRRGMEQAATHRNMWYRSTEFVIRHAVALGVAGTAVLIVAGVPFLDAKWGYPDDRVLPQSASAHQVGDRLRAQFPAQAGTQIIAVVPDAEGLSARDWTDYGAAASLLPDVVAVAVPSGTFVDGRWTGPSMGGAGTADGRGYATVVGDVALFSPAAEAQLDNVRAIGGPGGRDVEMTGATAVNRDSVRAVASRLPLVLGIIVTVIFAVLFVLTRSFVLPLKALVLNALSLSAAFGALVWIFQEGHLGGLGTTPTGTLVITIPVLLFCIAFGLSMDYEVFLLARIREFWMRSDRAAPDHDSSVVLGVAHTGRIVTAAALIMSISFAGLIAAQVSFMRMFGVGLVLAVLVDATLVRMVLLPAFMHLLGRWNWWAPRVFARSDASA